jgi:Zn-finger nucleic acid-binding protein
MQATDVEGDGMVTIDVCPSCQGAWYDQGELTRLDESIWTNVERHAFHDREGDRPRATCPKCKEAMYDGRPMQFHLEPLSPADAPELIVDRCPSCFGFWLDRGELERIVVIGDIYDELKQVERELNAKITSTEEHLRWVILVWSDLPFGNRAEIHALVNAKSRGRRVQQNALRLAEYAQLPPELRAIVDRWFDLPEVIRAQILTMVKEARRKANEPSPEEQPEEPARIAAPKSRPEGWSWLRWAAYRFSCYLAETGPNRSV